MASHPSRSRRRDTATGESPSSAEIRAARERIGYSQTAAARVIYCALRTWQGWEDGSREMHPALWELWQHKVGLRPAEVALDAITPG